LEKFRIKNKLSLQLQCRERQSEYLAAANSSARQISGQCIASISDSSRIRRLVPTSDRENREERVISSLFSGEPSPLRVFASRPRSESKRRSDSMRNRALNHNYKKRTRKMKKGKIKKKEKKKVVAQNGRTKRTRP